MRCCKKKPVLNHNLVYPYLIVHKLKVVNQIEYPGIGFLDQGWQGVAQTTEIKSIRDLRYGHFRNTLVC